MPDSFSPDPSAPLTPEREQEIREREAAATAGPWGTYHENPMSEYSRLIDIAADLEETNTGYRCRRYIGQLESDQIDNDPAHKDWRAEQDNDQSAADAEFIAHARQDVPALLAEIDRLRKQNAELDKECNEVIGERDHMHDVADKLAYAVAPIAVIGEHSSENDPWENALDHITPAAELVKLAERWQQMATHGDTTIGTFPGPAAAQLDAEVGERGRIYRKAASDILDVLRTGHIPHDLMTAAEEQQHGKQAGEQS